MAENRFGGMRTQAPSVSAPQADAPSSEELSPVSVQDAVGDDLASAKGVLELPRHVPDIRACIEQGAVSEDGHNFRGMFAAGMLMADWSGQVTEVHGGGRGVGFGLSGEAASLRADLIANADLQLLEDVAQGQKHVFDEETLPMSRQSRMAHGALCAMGYVNQERLIDGAARLAAHENQQMTALQTFAAEARGLDV